MKDTLDRTIFDAIPMALFVVDDDVEIQELNSAAGQFCGKESRAVYKKRGGDVLQCLHAQETPDGCGRAPACRHCVIRNSVKKSLDGQTVYRKRMSLHVKHEAGLRDLALLITTSPLQVNGKQRALLMVEDVTAAESLMSLIPVCVSCKKIRDDQQWKNFEDYFQEHAGVDFTHGLCPTCVKEVYPDAFSIFEDDSSSV